MKHREVETLLLDFLDGRLDARTRKGVQQHVDDCADCSAWVEMHRLLAGSPSAARTNHHPDSRLLALCAVRPDELFESDRSDLRRHLEDCQQCRREMEFVTAALSDARPAAEEAARPVRSTKAFPIWKLAAAAVFAAFAIGTLLATGVWRARPYDSRPPAGVTSAAAAPVEADLPAPPEAFSEPEIEGTRLIETQGGLMISRTKIKDGSTVTIRSGQVVAFGDGFQIGSRARVVVGGSPGNTVPKKPRAEKGQSGRRLNHV